MYSLAVVSFILFGGATLFAAYKAHTALRFGAYALYQALYHSLVILWVYEAIPFGRANPFMETVFVSVFLLLFYTFTAAFLYGAELLRVSMTRVELPPHFKPLYLLFIQIILCFCYSLFFLGEQSMPGFDFSYLLPGTLLAHTPLVSLAWPFGVYSLTFVVYFLLYCLIYRRFKTATGVFLTSSLIYFTPLPPVSIPFSIITTRFHDKDLLERPTETLQERREKITELLRNSPPKENSLVILPEDSRYIPLGDITSTLRDNFTSRYPSVTLVDGSTFLRAGGLRGTSAITFNPGLSGVHIRDKEFLFPYSEYTPYSIAALVQLSGGKALPDSRRGSGGGGFEYLGELVDIRMCSEVFSGSLYFETLFSSSTIIITQSNLDFLHEGPYGRAMYDGALKILAAGTRKHVIAAQNANHSMMIQPNGSVYKTFDEGISHHP